MSNLDHAIALYKKLPYCICKCGKHIEKEEGENNLGICNSCHSEGE